MNASSPKKRATFSLDSAVKEGLERIVPKSRRSGFVKDAIALALKELARQEALKAIREFKPYELKGPGTVETLREIRSRRDEQMVLRHSPVQK